MPWCATPTTTTFAFSLSRILCFVYSLSGVCAFLFCFALLLVFVWSCLRVCLWSLLCNCFQGFVCLTCNVLLCFLVIPCLSSHFPWFPQGSRMLFAHRMSNMSKIRIPKNLRGTERDIGRLTGTNKGDWGWLRGTEEDWWGFACFLLCCTLIFLRKNCRKLSAS